MTDKEISPKSSINAVNFESTFNLLHFNNPHIKMKNFIHTHTHTAKLNFITLLLFLTGFQSLTAQETLCDVHGGGTFTPIGTGPNSVVLASSLGSTNFGPGSKIHIQGAFVIDVNVSFNGCEVKMGSGAWVYTQGVVTLTIHNSYFFSCDNMWRGITINGRGSANVQSSSFSDAQYCFYFSVNPTNALFIGNVFDRNYVGIRVDNIPIITQNIYGNLFLCSGNLRLPYPNQQPLPGNRSLCGVQIENASLIVGNASQAYNSFVGLHAGIYANQSNLVVYKGYFFQMFDFDSSAGNENDAFGGRPGGRGILSVGGSLKVDFSPQINSITSVFNENENDGIFAEGADLIVKHCLFTRNTRGIVTAHNNAAENIDISGCKFEHLGQNPAGNEPVWGILAFLSNAFERANIDSCRFITSGNANAPQTYGIEAHGHPAGFGASINDNTFENFSTRSLQFIRINAGAADGFYLYNNDMTFHEIPGSINTKWGITVVTGSGFGHEISFCDVLGDNGSSDDTYTCGFHIERTPEIRMCTNSTDHGFRGFHFTGNSNKIDFRDNIHGVHFYGLHITTQSNSSAGEIGFQVQCANQWSTLPNAYPFDNAGLNQSTTWQSSIFTTHDPSALFTPPLSLQSPDNWIFCPDPEEPKYCIEKQSGEEARLTDFEYQVADGTYLTLSDIGTWEAQRRAYYKLLRFPELASELGNFYEQMGGSSAGQFAYAGAALRQAMIVPLAWRDSLAALRNVIEEKSDSLAMLAALTETPWTESQWLKVEALGDEIDAAMQKQKNVRTQIAIERNSALDAVSQLVENLPQNTLYEQAWVQYLTYAIRSGKGEVFDSTELESLRQLANSAQDVYGYAPQEAALLLPAGDPARQTSTLQCALDGGERQGHSEMPVAGSENSIRLYPNPAKDKIWIQFKTEKHPERIAVTSVTGMSLINLPLQDKSMVEIDVRSLENGIYLCQVAYTDGSVQSRKIIISR